MSTATSVDATVEGFPTPSLPKHAVNTDYAAIKEVHKILTVNAASVESDLGGCQNGYLRIILPTNKYYRVSGTAFIRPPNPEITAHVPSCTPPGEYKRILHKYVERRRMYDKCRTVGASLNNQLGFSFNDPYLSTLKNVYTG